MGLSGYFARSLDDLETALVSAKNNATGTVIICDIHIDENVFPIVPPGEALNNQVSAE
jgi:thiamine pyrophosphate-dependent acetolactate synthase large subunit-like protein